MYVDYKLVGKRIADRRRALGLKQAEVNELAGLSDKYLSNIERATSVMSIDVLMKLCSVLKTTPDKLLLGAVNEENNGQTVENINNLLGNMNSEQLNALFKIAQCISENNIIKPTE